jgi:alpha-L-fucosidase
LNVANRSQRLGEIDRVIQNGRFKDNWASLSQYAPPRWYREAKFGIFIHWGVYSVPAFGSEWYPRLMYMQGTPEYEHHVRTYGPQKQFGYKDFIPLFRAEKYDPAAWAALFAEAGARYVVPVAEHHDGFQMYGSDLSEWNAVEKGPHRDTVGELQAALEPYGLTLGVSSHRVEHWFFMGHGREFDSDVREPLTCGDLYWPAQPEGDLQDLCSRPAPSQEFMEDWLLRCCELVDKYRPKLFYFDWWIQHESMKPYLRKFAAYYYDRAEEWNAGSPSATSTTPSCSAAPCPTWSAGSSPTGSPSCGRPTPRSRATAGAIRTTTSINPRAAFFATWWISSAKTARFCSTSVPGRTAPSARRTRPCSGK